MREERIIVSQFEEMRVTNYYSIKQVNEHGSATIVGQIPADKEADYLELGMELTTWVQVKAVNGDQEVPLFYGVVRALEMQVENGYHILSIHLNTGSCLLDDVLYIRSFQEEGTSFSSILDTCNQSYSDADRIVMEGKDAVTSGLMVQYRESDWSFIKRLASHIHTVVVPDSKVKGINYFFGLPEKEKRVDFTSVNYRIKDDMSEYRMKRAHELLISYIDNRSYMIENREIYELGDWGEVDGVKRYIWKIETNMRGNELYHTYYLKTKAGIQIPKENHPKISGVSLFGNVIEVKDEKVKIELIKDDNTSKTGSRWFSFSTLYSSADGTGWYCMPEVGDTVRLHFPTDREEDAYVISAFHEAGGDGGRRSDPTCKFWRNKEGKEIQMTPEHLLMTNNDGMYIKLSDEDGITISSQGSITISAKENLKITSEDSYLELNALEKVRLRQGDTQMNVGGDLSFKGARIKL